MTPATPATLEEAATFLADATASGRPVRIGSDLALSALDRVLEHEAGDFTCTVEAGIRLTQLQAELAPKGQRLSLDPPGDPTIGSCLAANLSGPFRHRFGSPRDLVLGATLVLADGTIASSGGKVVKNVAGYDLAKLVCGSRGQLALIARVSLRLHPLPAATRTLVVTSPDVATVVRQVLASQLQPSAVDVLHPGRVALRFEGSERAVTAQTAVAAALVGGEEAIDDDVWAESRTRQSSAAGRIRFAPGNLEATLDSVNEAIVRPAAGIAYVPDAVPSDLTPGERRLNAAVKLQLDPTATFR